MLSCEIVLIITMYLQGVIKMPTQVIPNFSFLHKKTNYQLSIGKTTLKILEPSGEAEAPSCTTAPGKDLTEGQKRWLYSDHVAPPLSRHSVTHRGSS